LTNFERSGVAGICHRASDDDFRGHHQRQSHVEVITLFAAAP
jgi:hypothetical protein